MILLLLAAVFADSSASSDGGTYTVIGALVTATGLFIAAVVKTNRQAGDGWQAQLARYRVDADEAKVNHDQEMAELENKHLDEVRRLTESCRIEKSWMRDRIIMLENEHPEHGKTNFPPEVH